MVSVPKNSLIHIYLPLMWIRLLISKLMSWHRRNRWKRWDRFRFLFLYLFKLDHVRLNSSMLCWPVYWWNSSQSFIAGKTSELHWWECLPDWKLYFKARTGWSEDWSFSSSRNLHRQSSMQRQCILQHVSKGNPWRYTLQGNIGYFIEIYFTICFSRVGKCLQA